MNEVFDQFVTGMRNTTPLEYVAVFTGIASVWFSRIENILVYPVGLVNTIIYTYLSVKGELYGEATVNLYYTIMSIYGWMLWSKKDTRQRAVLQVTHSSKSEWMQQLIFFAVFFIAIYLALEWLRQYFSANTIPVADAFAAASAFTGMWLMAKKKVESWYWWLATNLVSIPLYFAKNYVFTSVYYLILFFMAINGLMIWRQRSRNG